VDLNVWKDGALSFFGAPAVLSAALIVPVDDVEEDDMAAGFYAKGDKVANTFWIDQVTGKRRAATAGELAAAQALNAALGGKFGSGYVATIAQADLDAIPYA
jgi:hypothetical protein